MGRLYILCPTSRPLIAYSGVKSSLSQSGYNMVALPPLEHHGHTSFRGGVAVLRPIRLIVP